MSTRQYPRIGRSTADRRWAKLPRDQGPRCCICGGKATHLVHVEVSYFRGEDEVFKTCSMHDSDPAALLAKQERGVA